MTTRVIRAVLLVGLAYVVLSAALPPERAQPWRVLAAGCLAVALLALRRSVARGRRPAHPVRGTAAAVEEPPAEQMVRLARLEAAVRLSTESARQFDRSLRPALVALAEERLAARHGVVLSERPEAARQLMGEELWRLYEAQRAGLVREGRGPRPAEVAELVDRVVSL